MRTVVSTITTRGQVTIPAEVRRHLGVGEHDQVAFVIEDDQVRLQPVEFTLNSAFGSVEPANRPEDFEVLTRNAKEERAARTLAKPGRPLDLYTAHPFLDFEDALSLAHMERQGIGIIASYDTDFDKIQGFTRDEPRA